MVQFESGAQMHPLLNKPLLSKLIEIMELGYHGDAMNCAKAGSGTPKVPKYLGTLGTPH